MNNEERLKRMILLALVALAIWFLAAIAPTSHHTPIQPNQLDKIECSADGGVDQSFQIDTVPGLSSINEVHCRDGVIVPAGH